jgi:protocatechuate 3,4-dioxygenase beta subunit
MSIYAYRRRQRRVSPGRPGAAGSDQPRLFGYLRSDAQGAYRFATIKPGSYPNSRNPAHIHFEVTAPNHDGRNYEIVFEGDPYISPQFRAQAREPFGGVAVVTARPTADWGLEVRCIHLRAR